MKEEPVVTIIRSGYANDDLWLRAIRQALFYGRVVLAIRVDGSPWHPTKDEVKEKQ